MNGNLFYFGIEKCIATEKVSKAGFIFNRTDQNRNRSGSTAALVWKGEGTIIIAALEDPNMPFPGIEPLYVHFHQKYLI